MEEDTTAAFAYIFGINRESILFACKSQFKMPQARLPCVNTIPHIFGAP